MYGALREHEPGTWPTFRKAGYTYPSQTIPFDATPRGPVPPTDSDVVWNAALHVFAVFSTLPTVLSRLGGSGASGQEVPTRLPE